MNLRLAMMMEWESYILVVREVEDLGVVCHVLVPIATWNTSQLSEGSSGAVKRYPWSNVNEGPVLTSVFVETTLGEV